MESFDLHIDLPQQQFSVTILPVELYDGIYPTYLRISFEGAECHLRMNEMNDWELCKGDALPEEYLNEIAEQILSQYRASA